MRRGVVLLMLVGCGRLGFESRAATDAVEACTTQNLACAGTALAVSCGGHCWSGCTDQVAEAVGASRCVAWGGKLAAVRAASDVACLRAVAPNISAWFGLTQLLGQPTPADGWSWNGDGLPLTFTNWQPGQPDDGTGTENNVEQCAYIHMDNTWRDRQCGDPFAFACELAP